MSGRVRGTQLRGALQSRTCAQSSGPITSARSPSRLAATARLSSSASSWARQSTRHRALAPTSSGRRQAVSSTSASHAASVTCGQSRKRLPAGSEAAAPVMRVWIAGSSTSTTAAYAASRPSAEASAALPSPPWVARYRESLGICRASAARTLSLGSSATMGMSGTMLARVTSTGRLSAQLAISLTNTSFWRAVPWRLKCSTRCSSSMSSSMYKAVSVGGGGSSSTASMAAERIRDG